jgi:hypothetical protein
MGQIGSYTITSQVVNGVTLHAPEEYWTLSEECKKKLGYECGPGKVGGKFVPDSIWGLNVTDSCQIHDCEYALGKTKEDKWIADCSLLTNISAQIENGSVFLRGIRRQTAMVYFSAVRDFGDSSFWKDKVKP